jgi:hypothetical protein
MLGMSHCYPSLATVFRFSLIVAAKGYYSGISLNPNVSNGPDKKRFDTAKLKLTWLSVSAVFSSSGLFAVSSSWSS